MPGTRTRWDPFTELGELRSRFDRPFDSGWTVPSARGRRRSTSCARTATWSRAPTCPGIQPEEVKIEVEDDVLTISSEHTQSKEEKDRNHVRRERRYGSFSRSMTLPVGISAKQIKAKTHAGVVEATIPLPKEAKKETVKITPTAG